MIQKVLWNGSEKIHGQNGPELMLNLTFYIAPDPEDPLKSMRDPIGYQWAYAKHLKEAGFVYEEPLPKIITVHPTPTTTRVQQVDFFVEPYDNGVLTGISIRGISDSQFDAKLRYSWSARPRLDGPWIYKSNGRLLERTSNVDIDGNPTVLKYRPEGISDADYATVYARRKYERIIPTKRMVPQSIIFARCRISRDIAMHPDPYTQRYPFNFDNLVGTVNGPLPTATQGDGEFAAERGLYLCIDSQVSTNDDGETWDIELQFLRDYRGHEEYSFWLDEYNQIPADITIPSGMTAIWPDDVSRVSFPTGATQLDSSTRGGVAKPKQLRICDDWNAPVPNGPIKNITDPIPPWDMHPWNLKLLYYGNLSEGFGVKPPHAGADDFDKPWY